MTFFTLQRRNHLKKIFVMRKPIRGEITQNIRQKWFIEWSEIILKITATLTKENTFRNSIAFCLTKSKQLHSYFFSRQNYLLLDTFMIVSFILLEVVFSH